MPPSSAARTSRGPSSRDRLRTAEGVARARRREPALVAVEAYTSSSRRCRPSTDSRFVAATRPGCTCWSATTGSTLVDPAVAGAARTAGPTIRCFASTCGARRRRRAWLRLQGRGRDRRARRQHRRAARRDRGRRAAAGWRSATSRPSASCSATPAGRVSASSPRPTPIRSTPIEIESADGPYVVGGAQRRRRQLRRPQGQRSAPDRSRPITTDAKVIPTMVSRRARRRRRRRPRRSGATRAPVRRIGGHRRQRRRRTPTSSHLALRGSGQALYVGLAEDTFIVASRALRRGRGDRHATCAWTARRRPTRQPRRQSRGQIVVLDGDRAGELDGHRPRIAYDGTPLAGRPRRPGPRPRSRRATSTAAITRTSCSRRSPSRRLVPQDAAGSPRRACDGLRVVARPTTSCPNGDPPTPRATARIAGSSSSVRAPPQSPARASRPRSTDAGRPTRHPVEAAAGHRAVRVRAARRHERHADRRHQPVGHHHRHQPHRRPGARPRRAGGGDRQPTRQRPHRQGRRRALHLRRARRRDERGRRPRRSTRRSPPGSCWRCAIADASCGRRAPPTHELLDGARATCPTAMEPCSATRRAIAEARAAQLRRRGATGPSSATARTGSPPTRSGSSCRELCYKSIACDATEDKKHIDLSSEPLILVCAAGLDRLERRRRGQGGRDLPGPQGRARS